MKKTIKKKHTKKNELNINKLDVYLIISKFKYLPSLIFSTYFIILSILSFAFHKIGDYGVETDFYWEYIPQAKQIINGVLAFDSYRGPIYQFILALFGFVSGGDFFHAGILINILSASFILVFIFKIVELIGNKEIALLTVLFTATNQYFIKYSYCCGTDMVFLVMYLLSIYYLFKSNFRVSKYILLSGLFCAISYLTRYTALSLIFAVVFIFIFQIVKMFYSKDKTIKKEYGQIIKITPLFFIPNFIIILIWGIVSYIYKGRFFYNDNFLNTALAVYKPAGMSTGEWAENYQIHFHSMIDVVFNDFSLFLKRIFIENFTYYFVLDMKNLLPWYIGIFTSIGLIIFIIKFRNLNLNLKYFLFINFVFYLFLTLIFYVERFSIPLLPFFFCLMIYVFSLNYLKFNTNKKVLKTFSFIIITIIFFINLYNSFIITKADIDSGPKEILLVSDWVRNNYNNGLRGKKVMARKPHIAYYTDAIFTPYVIISDYNDLLNKIKKDDADYLYISFNELSSYGRQINFLLDSKNPPNELETIYYLPSYKCVLYKVRK